MQVCDILIRNGTIVDGTGERKPFVGDVAIAGGKILAVGPSISLEFEAAVETIDAAGMHVMPGWTDVHTHYDTQCAAHLNSCASKLSHL